MERAAVTAGRAVLVVALVTVVGGTARFWAISTPEKKVFDEVYYASDGCLYAGFEFRQCGLDSDAEVSWVHPPLGKYLIAWGVDGFGNRPLGWRVSAAAAGTATIALTGALAFLLTRRAVWAGVAAVLIAAEHLHFVQSRVAMLDVFLAFFVVLAFLLLVWDKVRRDRLDARHAPGVGGSTRTGGPSGPPSRTEDVRPGDPSGPAEASTTAVLTRADAEASGPARLGWSGSRPLRIAAGTALGAAVAVKWAGVYAVAGALILALAWERTRRARRGVERPLRAAVMEEGLFIALALVVLPAILYAGSWWAWLSDHDFSLAAWWRNHLEIADYHLTLEPFKASGEPIHPYMSKAWEWLLLRRPVAYFYEGGDGTAAEILGIGNPFLFWGALLYIPYLALAWRSQRDWRAGAILVPLLIQYVPWLFVTRPLFLFYMTPATPFMALGATRVLRDFVAEARSGRSAAATAAGLAVAAVVGCFVFFWPVLVGDTIGQEAWRSRIWFTSWI